MDTLISLLAGCEGLPQPSRRGLTRSREIEDLRFKLEAERNKGFWRRLFGK